MIEKSIFNSKHRFVAFLMFFILFFFSCFILASVFFRFNVLRFEVFHVDIRLGRMYIYIPSVYTFIFIDLIVDKLYIYIYMMYYIIHIDSVLFEGF